MIKYLIHFRSLTLICLCLGSRAGGRAGGLGDGGGARAALASVFSSVAESLFIRCVTERRKDGGGREASLTCLPRRPSAAACSVGAARCHPISFCPGTRQCPGNRFPLLNNFFPAGLLLDQTSSFTRQLINCHINLLSMLTSWLDWMVNSGPV